MQQLTVGALRERVSQQFNQAKDELAQLIGIPSFVGSGRVGDSAEMVAELARQAGFQGVELVRVNLPDGTAGAPAVIGHIDGPEGAFTVLLYAHHDVQPVQGDWESDPFEAVERDGRLYGRGAADDGAGVATHLAAVRALAGQVPVTVKLLIEGDEEVGSPGFGQLLRERQEYLRADAAVVADSGNWSADTPGLTTQLRGLAWLKVTLRIAHFGSHSGFAGGPILDAPLLLARLIATLHDDAGDVAVEGLEWTGHFDLDYPEAQFRADAGLLDSVILAGTGSLADRLWNAPAIALIGFDAPRTDMVSNTVVEVASAVLSLRVPPDMDATAALAALHRHLKENAPFGAAVEVEDGLAKPGFKADVEAPAARAARWALSEGFGKPAVLLGQGGSIPLAAEIVEVFPEMEVLLTGVEDPTSNPHAANESVSLAMLEKAILSEVLLLAKLGGQLG